VVTWSIACIHGRWKISDHLLRAKPGNDAAKREKYHPRKAHLNVDSTGKLDTVWRLKG
jgi:hypothetical protein